MVNPVAMMSTAAERDRELVAVGVPAVGGHEEAGWVGVAATGGPIQATRAQRVADREPQPQGQRV